ncbi:hypothetical protein K504DRAFT_457236 [Pleomassaria siparia CBS 279.74]|uniref:AA1-like domain-containing protein n=1 Tax=Pleomassaria siparia CBS 279.74 TaxID=1314801 RepID=A0A6G1KR21_9PLEO|nr:hypothetical protein K504DRAFT_457236 [Pleomassaria siparia CBS 279.74]
MRFSILSFIGLTSAAVLPRGTTPGSWNVTLTVSSAANGYNARELTAIYSSPDTAPVTTTCTYTYIPTQATVDTCTDASFKYTYSGTTVSVTQTVDNITLSGEKELSETCNGSGRSCTIQGTVPATSASA